MMVDCGSKHPQRKSHLDHEKIYVLLRGLKQQMKEEGYVPETKFVLHDVDDESKEEALMAHSERLAAAKGYMTSAARADLRIIKNLSVCGDCHKAFKIISKIVGRAVIARDTKRFHRFENGFCLASRIQSYFNDLSAPKSTLNIIA